MEWVSAVEEHLEGLPAEPCENRTWLPRVPTQWTRETIRLRGTTHHPLYTELFQKFLPFTLAKSKWSIRRSTVCVDSRMAGSMAVSFGSQRKKSVRLALPPLQYNIYLKRQEEHIFHKALLETPSRWKGNPFGGYQCLIPAAAAAPILPPLCRWLSTILYGECVKFYVKLITVELAQDGVWTWRVPECEWRVKGKPVKVIKWWVPGRKKRLCPRRQWQWKRGRAALDKLCMYGQGSHYRHISCVSCLLTV